MTSIWETLVEEDLDVGTGTATKHVPGGGTATGHQVNLASLATEVSETYDPTTIAPGEYLVHDVTVSGAAVGDFALASFSGAAAGAQISATVTATNTVSVMFLNTGATNLDLSSGTLKVLVFKV